jgi:hypothetical protein
MKNNEPTAKTTLATMETELIEYSTTWTPQSISIAANGVTLVTFANDGKCRADTWPYDLPFKLKLNLAIGGAWGGIEGVDASLFPAEFQIDYVRVYQRRETPTVCSRTRYYAVFAPSANGPSLPDMVTSVLATPQNYATFTTLAKSAIAQQLALSPTVADSAIAFDVVAPFRAEGQVRLMVNFTVLGATTATDDKFSSVGSSVAFSSVISWLNVNVRKSGTSTDAGWAVASVGRTCAGCFTASGVPAPMPFATFTMPGTVPVAAYDMGGQGVAYWDFTEWNQYGTGTWRGGPDGVDLTAVVGSAYPGVGYSESGEWLVYSDITSPPCTTDAPAPDGKITVRASFMAGNGNPDSGVVMMLFTPVEADGEFVSCEAWSPVCASTMVSILPTGSWTSIEQSPRGVVSLTCGQRYRVRLSFPVSTYLLVSMKFETA